MLFSLINLSARSIVSICWLVFSALTTKILFSASSGLSPAAFAIDSILSGLNVPSVSTKSALPAKPPLPIGN